MTRSPIKLIISLLLFLLGLGLSFLGFLFKLESWENANLLLSMGFLLQLLGGGALLYRVLQHNKN